MTEKKGPICKKIFVPAPFHSYKKANGALVCSYHCFIECERRAEEKKRRKKGADNEQREAD